MLLFCNVQLSVHTQFFSIDYFRTILLQIFGFFDEKHIMSNHSMSNFKMSDFRDNVFVLYSFFLLKMYLIT